MKLRPALHTKPERDFFVLAGLLFTALVLLNYWPVFIGKVPLPAHLVTSFPAWAESGFREPMQPVADIGDLIDYFYPFNAFSTQQIRQGIIPHWNPYVIGGMPFQAEPQSALFYPLHALYYVLSTPTAWSLALILRMVLGAMFMTLLMRSIGATQTGAIVSGIAFAFSGFMVAWQGAVMGDAVMWLPLVCYSVHRLHMRRSFRSLALAAFAFSMPVLAGHPETAAHVILTGVAAALLLWAFPPTGRSRFDMGFLLCLFFAGLLAIGLSAVQLFPTLEWIRQSNRDLNAIWPSFELHQGLGFFSRDALRGPNSAGVFVPNAMGYAGMLTLLAAALAPLHRPTRYFVWFAGLVAIGIAGTFGFEPVRWLLTHIPIVKGLKNERLILLVNFGLAALAGLGISALQEEAPNRSRARRVMPWLLVTSTFIVAMVCVHKLQLATTFSVEILRRPSFSRALLLAAMTAIVWKLLRMERARLFPFVVIGLLGFDLATFAYGYTGFASRNNIFPAAPVFDFLKKQGSPESFRIARIGSPYAQNSAIFYSVQSLTGFEAAVPEPLRRFTWDFTEDWLDSVFIVGEKLLAYDDRRLDMLNVKFIVMPSSEREYPMFSEHRHRFSEVFKSERVAVFENKKVLPRAFVVGVDGVRVISGITEQFQVLKDPALDPLRSVVVEVLPEELAEVRASEAAFSGSVEIAESDISGYRFQVQATTPGILVVSQNFYPGWKATVNGSPASVFPANHALTGIAVPAGAHEVHFRFHPPGFRLGALLSVISAMVLGASIVFRHYATNEKKS